VGEARASRVGAPNATPLATRQCSQPCPRPGQRRCRSQPASQRHLARPARGESQRHGRRSRASAMSLAGARNARAQVAQSSAAPRKGRTRALQRRRAASSSLLGQALSIPPQGRSFIAGHVQAAHDQALLERPPAPAGHGRAGRSSHEPYLKRAGAGHDGFMLAQAAVAPSTGSSATSTAASPFWGSLSSSSSSDRPSVGLRGRCWSSLLRAFQGAGAGGLIVLVQAWSVTSSRHGTREVPDPLRRGLRRGRCRRATARRPPNRRASGVHLASSVAPHQAQRVAASRQKRRWTPQTLCLGCRRNPS
jgi:hypothetical protein